MHEEVISQPKQSNKATDDTENHANVECQPQDICKKENSLFQRVSGAASLSQRLHLVCSSASQPTFKVLKFAPFDPKRVYYRRIAENKYFARSWVTVTVEEEQIKKVF